MTNVPNIKIENAKLVFRNFSGVQTSFNPKDKRNFCVLIDTDIAERLTEDGWNIKWLKPRDPADSDQAFLKVNVRFDPKPPKIELVSSKNKTRLMDNMVNILDYAEIANVDLVITPYDYDFNGRKGVAAYVKTMYVTLVEDEFDSKYMDVPDAHPMMGNDD